MGTPQNLRVDRAPPPSEQVAGIQLHRSAHPTRMHMTDNSTSALPTPDPDVEPGAARRARARPPTTAPRSATSTSGPEIVEALADVGIVKTFAIQELTLPIALAGSDLIGQARTGTGKTLGFGVPLLNRLNLPGGDGRRAAGAGHRPDPRARRAGLRRPRRGRQEARRAGADDLRRTRVRAADRGAAQGHRRRRRHARAACSTWPSRAISCSATSASWCWTRPTRCSTSASCPTSRS